MNISKTRIVYAPSMLGNDALYSQWQYMLYEKSKSLGTRFLDLQIAAYEKEMIKRSGNLFDFIENERKKLI
jgi:hypothetical protein